MWSSAPNVYDCKGNVISTTKPSVNFRIYWDGDLQDELLDGVKCDKWNGNGTTRLKTFDGQACNGTKNTPCLQADLFGDWREEVIFHNGADKIYINTTTIATQYRLFTLMHDAVYRMGVAWQNTAYNQPPHLGFYIGDGIGNVKQPDIYTAGQSATPVVPTEATLEVSGMLNQEIFSEEQISPITFTFGGAATDLVIDNLPAGLKTDRKDNTIIVSGSVAENCSFKVTTKGGEKVVSQTVTIKLAPEGLKNVAYITDPSSADYAKDKVLAHLRTCDDLYVREISSDLKGVDFSRFNLIVISELTPSTAPIVAELSKVNLAKLSMKVHAYKNAEGAWYWAKGGYGDNTTATTIVVENKFKNHPMFKDVHFGADNSIKMFNEVDTKALTYMNPDQFTDAVGTINTVAKVDGEDQVCIFEMAPGSSVAGTMLAKPYIQIGLNSSSYSLITDDGLSVVKNACYYLLDYTEGYTSEELIGADSNECVVLNGAGGPVLLFNSDACQVVKVTIVSANGQVMASSEHEVAAGNNEIHLDASLRKGVYMIITNTRESQYSNKYIVK